MLKSGLGGNREYFHSQTLGDSDRLKAGETGDWRVEDQRWRLGKNEEDLPLFVLVEDAKVAYCGGRN